MISIIYMNTMLMISIIHTMFDNTYIKLIVQENWVRVHSQVYGQNLYKYHVLTCFPHHTLIILI